MHATCWQKYFDDVSETERRRYRLALWLFSYLPY
jgi:hypothetical protein